MERLQTTRNTNVVFTENEPYKIFLRIVIEPESDVASTKGYGANRPSELSCVGISEGARPIKRAEIAFAARAHMLENLDDAITVRGLSRALGVSERTLRYAFHKEYGISPSRYLKSTRLQ